VSEQTTADVFATDRLEQIIDAYVADYELVGEDESGRDGCYAPTDTERGLIKDAIIGLLADPDWDAEWGKLIALRASDSADTERHGSDKAVPNRDVSAYIASLVAERDALREDAERLDWLQEHNETVYRCTHVLRVPSTMPGVSYEERCVFDGWAVRSDQEPSPTIRAAIDAARSALSAKEPS
jgi:hypothetical protein